MFENIKNLFRKSELVSSQLDGTPQTQFLTHEFAGHLGDRLTPQRLNQILKRAEEGWLVDQCDLFEDMEERDGHICAELSKRKRTLLGLRWKIEPPHSASAQEKALAEIVQNLFLEIPDFEDVLLNMSEAIGFGFACLEIQWQLKDKVWQPANMLHRPARWFQLSQTDRNKINLRDGSANGAELWQAGWLVHKHKAKSGDVSRMGLHRALAFPYLFKHYAANDLAEFLEIYGLPMRLGSYPNGASSEEKNRLMQAVSMIGHSAAGIIPDGQKIEFVEASKGTGEPFRTMIDWCESTQSKVILGGTLTSQADGKSSTNALGNVHNEVRRDLLISDAMQIASSLSRFVALICQVNGWQGRPPKFAFDVTESEDLALFADAFPKLVAVGMQVPLSFLHEKLKIPLPINGEAVLGASQSVINPKAALSMDLAPIKFTPEQQVIEKIADDLLDNVTAPLSNAQLQQVIRAAKSPEDLEKRLAILMANADFTEFSDTLSKAIFAADVLGYAHA